MRSKIKILKKSDVQVPLIVPVKEKENYIQNYLDATKKTGKLFLFAGDQKIEHLNKDFYGKSIPLCCAIPKHLFDIASQAPIGVFATQLGLISRYGEDYPDINYVVKLNSKTDLVSTKQSEPISLSLNSVQDVVELKKNSKIKIVGVGYTVYLGSEYESEMLTQAAQIVYQAHQNGMLAILWMYPRGQAIKNEFDANLIAGAAGVASCLGADFVKINPPHAQTSLQSAKDLNQAVLAAGKTKVICSGGKKVDEKDFLKNLYDQINVAGVAGCAVGRNIHQKELKNAIKFCKAIDSIVYKTLSLKQAEKFLE